MTRTLPTRHTRQGRGPAAPLRPRLGYPVLAFVSSLLAMTSLIIVTVSPPHDDGPVVGQFLFPAMLAVIVWASRGPGRAEQRFDLRSILIAGFSLRVLGAVVRYSQPVDAFVYHKEGVRLASLLRGFDLYPETGQSIPGTGWIRYVSGIVHVVVFDDMISTFLVFTLFSFVGCFLLYRAFVHAVPHGDHKRYALLIFLWPSLCFWPSSIGKEAWMILGLGILAWGVSRAFTHQLLPGLAVTGCGLAVMSLARPHVALMTVAGIGVALLARPGTKKGSVRALGRMLSIALLLVGGSIITGQTSERLKIDNEGTEGLTEALDQIALQTGQGTGAFTPMVVHTPLDYPGAFTTVWFRPFPPEARAAGGTQVLSSIENLLLIGLFLASWRRLRSLPQALLRVPYVTFATTYAVVFVYAFAVIGNFGILARQRTQGLVLLFVVLCLPVPGGAIKTSLSDLRAARADRWHTRRHLTGDPLRPRSRRAGRDLPLPEPEDDLVPGGPRRRSPSSPRRAPARTTRTPTDRSVTKRS